MRHGATPWNAEKRFQGHSDVELSPEGQRQAAAIAERLRGERIDRMYASDLSRARETARAIAAPHGLPVREDARLREFAFGAWEGLTWAEIVATRPELDRDGWSGAKHYAPEGGETFERVCERIRAFLADLAVACEPGDHVALVTHAGPLHAALTVLGLAQGEVRFLPASITRVAMDGGPPRLMTVSDVQHLHPAG